MDKNTIIGLVLMAAVLIGFSWYNTNQENNLQRLRGQQTKQPQNNHIWKSPARSSIRAFTSSVVRLVTAHYTFLLAQIGSQASVMSIPSFSAVVMMIRAIQS